MITLDQAIESCRQLGGENATIVSAFLQQLKREENCLTIAVKGGRVRFNGYKATIKVECEQPFKEEVYLDAYGRAHCIGVESEVRCIAEIKSIGPFELYEQ
jgi:uncharacterized metal-binding protein